MKPYIDGAISDDAFRAILDKTYARFRHPGVVPMSQIGSNSWLLELYHGPTLAFKDVALCLLGNLFEHFLSKKVRNSPLLVQHLVILVLLLLKGYVVLILLKSLFSILRAAHLMYSANK